VLVQDGREFALEVEEGRDDSPGIASACVLDRLVEFVASHSSGPPLPVALSGPLAVPELPVTGQLIVAHPIHTVTLGRGAVVQSEFGQCLERPATVLQESNSNGEYAHLDQS